MSDKFELLSIDDYFDTYWDDSERLRLSVNEAQELGLSQSDVVVISDVGLPRFAAPHLSFHRPSQLGESKVSIGEDADNRPIVMETQTRKIMVLRSDRAYFMSIGIDGLLFLLVMYAAMVERAIAENRGAFARNEIPLAIVDAFQQVMRKDLGRFFSGSFVEQEVIRLSQGRLL